MNSRMYFVQREKKCRLGKTFPMTLTLTYVVKVTTLSDFQEILIIARYPLKSY